MYSDIQYSVVKNMRKHIVCFKENSVWMRGLLALIKTKYEQETCYSD